MMELKLNLDFACHGCVRPVCVTVKCSGKGLSAGSDQTIASVNVPCPHCGQVNLISFEPSGTVRSVRSCVNPWPGPVPSVN